MPDALYGRLDVNRVDRYTISYNDYLAQTAAKIDGRTIVISSIIILSLAMLYLMQRSKIKDRMDLIAVYRLLGIPKQMVQEPLIRINLKFLLQRIPHYMLFGKKLFLFLLTLMEVLIQCYLCIFQ
jgi:NADH:ubiquinone oxidoreductase subunit 2 (subunit N)